MGTYARAAPATHVSGHRKADPLPSDGTSTEVPWHAASLPIEGVAIRAGLMRAKQCDEVRSQASRQRTAPDWTEASHSNKRGG